VHAPKDAADLLIESCANIRAMTKDIFAPARGESVQIGQQTNTFSISISDELLASIKMSTVSLFPLFSSDPPLINSQFEDNEVGYVTGRVVAHASSTIPTLEPLSEFTGPVQSAARDSKSAPRMLGSRPTVDLPHSTMIGELKLTVLKARLAAIGVPAELIGEGVLICGTAAGTMSGSDALEDSVAVRKTASGKVELEGGASQVYYTVRKEIYNLHALVAT
jgi:cleavage and polyadenylation specificity factor subunit 2